MITPNSRYRLTAEDFDFIVRVLSIKSSDRISLGKLLTDEGTRNEILDLESLASAVLESPDRLMISPQLLFYVLCRKVLRDKSIASREVADYVASLLDALTRTTHMSEPGGTRHPLSPYFCDMLATLATAEGHEEFVLRAHMADYSLFLSGMFPENLKKRSSHGAPDISFYEGMGGMNYRVAAEHRDAKRFHLQSVYEDLSRGFHEVRLALNDLAGRLLHLDDCLPAPVIGA